jgi:hypothetical protein
MMSIRTQNGVFTMRVVFPWSTCAIMAQFLTLIGSYVLIARTEVGRTAPVAILTEARVRSSGSSSRWRENITDEYYVSTGDIGDNL